MANYKGGYIIVSLNNVNLTVGSTVTVKGIYDRIETANKPISLQDIVIDGVEKNTVFTFVTVSGDKFVISVYGYQLTINSNDEVTVAIAV